MSRRTGVSLRCGALLRVGLLGGRRRALQALVAVTLGVATISAAWAQRWIGLCLSYAEAEASVLGWSVRVARQDGVDLAHSELDLESPPGRTHVDDSIDLEAAFVAVVEDLPAERLCVHAKVAEDE